MDSMDEKLIPIVEENKELNIRVDTLEKEIETLKRARRNNNIVVFGIEEKEKSTIELLRELKENIKEDLNIDIVNNEVNKIHRIGKKDPECNKPRPGIETTTSNRKERKNNEYCKHQKSIIYIAALNVLTLKEDENLIELTHTLEHIKWDFVGLLEEAFADWTTDLQKIKKSQIVE
ncbi:hypothetical protein WA026_004761 [Henosepilachna vigintioctopunctata]|uniref:Uncharacterized protein n=1 Tax=Henosepilachna vigintioctopunctata TaxID=420089 RepID=A0AAW1V7U0_9CUCU